MNKFILRFLLVSGTLIGIAYLKKDEILDALIQHSIDVNEIDATVDNLIDKTNTTVKKINDAHDVISDSTKVFANLKNDLQEYSNKVQPIIGNLKQPIHKK